MALHKWNSLEVMNATFVWADPRNQITAIYEVSVNSNGSGGQPYNLMIQKPRLKTPLLPGIWRLIIFHKLEVIAQTSFLVSPLLFLNATPIDQRMAHTIHNGSHTTFHSPNAELADIIIANGLSLADHRDAFPKGSPADQILIEWVDQLYSRFWFSSQICYISESTDFGVHVDCGRHLNPCHLTDWSSRSPDPKSDISNLL